MNDEPRIHRTLEQWQAIQKELADRPTPPIQGHPGSVEVTIDGMPWQAPSVADLEAQGLQVEVRYTRRWGWYRRGAWHDIKADGSQGKTTEISYRKGPRHNGGRAHVRILDPKGRRYGEGAAFCTAQDIFDKRKGYVLAVNRALADLQR